MPNNSTEQALEDIHADLEIIKKNVDHFFLFMIAIIIFFMQGGFAFLEAGSVRSKNTVNILFKNILDCFIGGVSYWAIGWGLAYGSGGNDFCGGSEFFNFRLSYDMYPKWIFQYVFAATSATIVSGAIAERCQFGAYFLYSVLLTAWVYPPVSHWAWDSGDAMGIGQGWLNRAGYKDFAGSGVVHLVGGCASLVGCYFIGKRRGRFNKKGEVLDMPGHSVPLAGLGGFILIFGFLAFNGGSQASITKEGDGAAVALAIVNTILGACSGGMCVLFVNRFLLRQPWSFLMTLNGALIGMVSMCAGCNLYEPWAAIVIGTGAGFFYVGVHFLMFRFRLDDPLDAVAVHFTGGLYGLVVLPFFMYANQEVGERGIFWDGGVSFPWIVLGYQLIGALSIMVWSFGWSIIIFGGLWYFKLLRVDADIEFIGMDIPKHGEAAYPAQAWVEQQYNVAAGQKGKDIPQHMAGVSTNFGDLAAHNNPMEMLPSAGKLFNGLTRLATIKQFELLPHKEGSVEMQEQATEKGVDNLACTK